MEAMSYIDFLFGNEIEAAAFAATEGMEGRPLEEVALAVRRAGCTLLYCLRVGTVRDTSTDTESQRQRGGGAGGACRSTVHRAKRSGRATPACSKAQCI